MPTLQSLPPEILFQILTFLTLSHNRHPSSPHPLNSLASTSAHFHAIIESHTRSLLKQYTNSKQARHTKGFCYRRKWLAQTCQFCKRKSERRAIFYVNLTCCRLCDKQYFPKMTMTQAITIHHLSKLDLFTPNALHPSLQPLTTGLYTVMGSPATMILSSDVLHRKSHIHALLGTKLVETQGYMPRRTAQHERLIAHMGIFLHTRRLMWSRAPALSEGELAKASKSMQNEEARKEYVRKGLEQEWRIMGMGEGEDGDGGVVREILMMKRGVCVERYTRDE